MSDAFAEAVDAGKDIVGTEARLADIMAAFAVMRFENTRLLNGISRRLGIAGSDFRALFFIGGAESVTPKQVADYLGLTTGAMTSLVDRIERAGLARRVANPKDRRSIIIELTVEGREAVTEGGRRYSEAFDAGVPASDRVVVGAAFAQLGAELRRAADAVAS